MNEEDLAAFKRRLEADRAQLIGDGDEKLSPNRTDDAGRRDEDGQPLNEMMQAIASHKNKNRTQKLAQIDATLARIKAAPEDFGLCVECDDEIPLKRLQLMPHVSLCVKCQSKTEGARTVGRRNLTDYT